MPTNYLTLTRQSLYDLVWSKPMRELAKEFGISDVGLAKRCRLVDVPVPPRGWWARKAAGQDPSMTPLPKYRRTSQVESEGPRPSSVKRTSADPAIRGGEEPEVRFGKPKVPPPTKYEPPASPAVAAMSARVNSLTIRIPADLRSAHPAIKRTAVHLRSAKVSEVERAPADRRGPVVTLSVSKNHLARALKLASALLTAAAELGWSFEGPAEKPERSNRWAPPQPYVPPSGHLAVDGEPIAFRIDEHYRQVERTLSDDEKKAKAQGRYFGRPWVHVPSGNLRLHLIGFADRPFHTLKDAVSIPLEQKISRALILLYAHALELKERRESDRRAEEARRERERLESLAAERRKAQRELIAQLERQAGAWLRARLLRRYIAAARRQIGPHKVPIRFQDQDIDFLDWAERYVRQLDPLSKSPYNADQRYEKQTYYYDEEWALKHTFLRLFGFEGEPWKLADRTSAISDDWEDD